MSHVRLVEPFDEEAVRPDGIRLSLPSDQLDAEARLMKARPNQTPDRSSTVDGNLHVVQFSPSAPLGPARTLQMKRAIARRMDRLRCYETCYYVCSV